MSKESNTMEGSNAINKLLTPVFEEYPQFPCVTDETYWIVGFMRNYQNWTKIVRCESDLRLAVNNRFDNAPMDFENAMKIPKGTKIKIGTIYNQPFNPFITIGVIRYLPAHLK